MTRLRGMEKLADEAELVADFVTLTLPSKFHAMLDSGELNKNFNGATVREGQQQLREWWTRFRAQAAKKEIFYYGVRVAEPHHDGTAHWHLVLYTLACDRETVRELLRKQWMSIDGNEPGAAYHRIKFVACDRAKGSATGYISKYIAKNVDGFRVGADFAASAADGEIIPLESEVDSKETAPRVLTWAWIHGIRQFQFFGTARVGLWRELRKIREPIDECGEMEVARLAADEGDWARFVNTIGGVFVGPNTEINLWKEITGELNHYDELAGPQIVGIQNAEGMLRTRLKVWRLERGSDSSLGPVSITVTSAAGPGNPGGWTNPRETGTYGPN
jgi:Bacteriophage replication gene A protein (GPA)